MPVNSLYLRRLVRSAIFTAALGIIACALLYAFADSANATEQHLAPLTQYTMQNAVQKAVQDNPAMQSARSGKRMAEAGEKAAMGNFGPKLSADYGFKHSDHRKPKELPVVTIPPLGSGLPSLPPIPLTFFPQYKQDMYQLEVTLRQPLFTGFGLLSQYEKARLQKEQAAAGIAHATLKLTFAVQQTFLQMLAAEEIAMSAEKQVERLQNHLTVAKSYYNTGLRPILDVLEAERNLSEAEDKRLQAQNAVQTQKALLNTYLALPVQAAVQYEGSLKSLPFDAELEECIERAYRLRPDIVIAAKSVAMAKEDKRAAKSAFYPHIGAEASLSRIGDSALVNGGKTPTLSTEFSEWSAGIALHWELFNSGSDYYTHEAAGERIHQLQAEEEKLRSEVAYEITARHLKFAEAKKRILVGQKTVAQAKEAYRMARAGYKAQVNTTSQVLDAQTALAGAEAALTKAQAEYMISLAGLYSAMGVNNAGLTPQALP